MKLTEFFLAELDREAASSRQALQRVPEDRNDWKPHPKSMPLGYLASLVATMPSWIVSMVKQDELDLKSPAAAKFKPLEWRKREELIAALDTAVAEARDRGAGARFDGGAKRRVDAADTALDRQSLTAQELGEPARRLHFLVGELGVVVDRAGQALEVVAEAVDGLVDEIFDAHALVSGVWRDVDRRRVYSGP